MKRKNLLLTLASVATVVLMALLMAGCGDTAEEPEATTEAAQTTNIVSGIVEDLSDGNLSVYTEAAEDITFNIENAAIESEDGIKPGDTATVEYEGEITNGDASGCTVVKVTDVAGAETTIEGKVESIGSDNTVTISSNGKKYTFAATDAEKGSIKTGDTIKVKYAGVIDDEDTSHAYVRSMEVAEKTEPTETTANDVTIKAVNETVWASADVNVRAEASTDSDRIATVKKGQKLTRTGVLSNGWSRVTYKDKDRYIASSYLTTKEPAKKQTETKATETKTKATETKATETKTEPTETKTEPTETKTEPTEEPTVEPTEEPTEEPTAEPTEEPTEEPTAEPTEEPTEETDPPTVTAKGIVEEVGANSLTLDDGNTYNLKGAKVEGITAEDAVGQEVVVEYYEESLDAVHVYPVDGAKSLDDNASGAGGATKIAILLALIAIAIAVIVVIARNRRKTA